MIKNKGFTHTPTLGHNKAKWVCGFTLIELLVSTTIFVMIMLSAMGSLFVLLNAAKNSRALRFSIDNVNFAMESMSRSIRMGTNYYCLEEPGEVNLREASDEVRDCADSGKYLAFTPQDASTSYPRIAYMVTGDSETNTATIKKCTKDGCVSILSPNVNVEKFYFFVNGAEDDTRQAGVYMIIKGTVMVKDTPIPFSIQTMASMRNF